MSWVIITKQIVSSGDEYMLLPVIQKMCTPKRSKWSRAGHFAIDACWYLGKYFFLYKLYPTK